MWERPGDSPRVRDARVGAGPKRQRMAMDSATVPHGAAAPGEAARPHLELEPVELAEKFNRIPFLFRHRLQDHPLLKLGSLADLALRLPEHRVRCDRAQKPMTEDFDAGLLRSRSTAVHEALRGLETADTFILLSHAEEDPAVASLLQEALAEIRPYSEPLDPGMRDPAVFIFIASPRSVTPYHMDRESIFLCQLRGTKEYHIWRPAQSPDVTEEEFEVFFSRIDIPRPRYRDEYVRSEFVFQLGPGTGVHQPFTSPHWVRCGDEVSIAIALAFRTRSKVRRMTIHRANHALRKLGLAPAPFGKSAVRDELKYRAYSAYRRLRDAFLHNP